MDIAEAFKLFIEVHGGSVEYKFVELTSFGGKHHFYANSCPVVSFDEMTSREPEKIGKRFVSLEEASKFPVKDFCEYCEDVFLSPRVTDVAYINLNHFLEAVIFNDKAKSFFSSNLKNLPFETLLLKAEFLNSYKTLPLNKISKFNDILPDDSPFRVSFKETSFKINEFIESLRSDVNFMKAFLNHCASIVSKRLIDTSNVTALTSNLIGVIFEKSLNTFIEALSSETDWVISNKDFTFTPLTKMADLLFDMSDSNSDFYAVPLPVFEILDSIGNIPYSYFVVNKKPTKEILSTFKILVKDKKQPENDTFEVSVLEELFEIASNV